jgi:anti-sigma factor RsiW
MTLAQSLIDEYELMAFIDGVLDPERQHRFEELMRHDAELAATVAALRAQRTALRSSLDSVLMEPIPQRLLRTAAPSRFPLARVAAVVTWLTIGMTVGSFASWQYFSRQESAAEHVAWGSNAPDLPRFVHQATVAHAVYAPDGTHPVELDSSESQALSTWLSERLGRKMNAPDLSRRGFTLMGGRLLPAEVGKPAAQFMYENRQGQRLTVYLRGMAQPTPETTFRYAEQERVSTFYWVERDWGYALNGELTRSQLLQLARDIHEQLT